MRSVCPYLVAALIVVASAGRVGAQESAPALRQTVGATSTVKVEGKRFVQDGREILLNGVNYFPAYFPSGFPDSWLKSGRYRPEVIDADLATVRTLGMNLVSIAAAGQGNRVEPRDCDNIRDFLNRARQHGLLVHMYIGGGSRLPLADPKAVAAIPRLCALSGHPALFAYDIAWEPHFGTAGQRASLQAAWQEWLVSAYHSLDSAAKAFGGEYRLPTDDELCADAPSVKIAAFRRFLDGLVSASYREARQAILAVDSTHLIGVRSGWGGNGSRQLCKGAPPDLRAGVRHLDFVSPEAHALPAGNRMEVLRRGGFTTAYADIGKPVFWAEYGANVDGSCVSCTEATQAAFFSSMFEMLRNSGANGAAAWWFVGVRPQNSQDSEKSDFGIVREPSPSSAGPVVVRPAARLLPDAFRGVGTGDRTYDKWINVDRDTAAGDWKMYDNGTLAYAAATAGGGRAGVKTACTGTSSREAPLCVGNMANNGFCPAKCLDAEWDAISILNAQGVWQAVRNQDEVVVTAGAPVKAQLVAGNTGESLWLSAASTKGHAGTVRFGCNENLGEIGCRHEITRDTESLMSARSGTLLITPGNRSSTRVVFQMVAENVAWFGDPVRVTLISQVK